MEKDVVWSRISVFVACAVHEVQHPVNNGRFEIQDTISIIDVLLNAAKEGWLISTKNNCLIVSEELSYLPLACQGGFENCRPSADDQFMDLPRLVTTLYLEVGKLADSGESIAVVVFWTDAQTLGRGGHIRIWTLLWQLLITKKKPRHGTWRLELSERILRLYTFPSSVSMDRYARVWSEMNGRGRITKDRVAVFRPMNANLVVRWTKWFLRWPDGPGDNLFTYKHYSLGWRRIAQLSLSCIESWPLPASSTLSGWCWENEPPWIGLIQIEGSGVSSRIPGQAVHQSISEVEANASPPRVIHRAISHSTSIVFHLNFWLV